jgi:hypothetical protein
LKIHRLLSVLFALSACGCTNAVHSPVFPDSQPDQVVKPLRDYLPSASAPPRPVVKVLLVHGMTHQDVNWADDFIQAFASRLGIKVPRCDSPISLPTPSPPGHPAQLCVVGGSGADIDYQFFALHWSPLTDPYKCRDPFLGDRESGDPILATPDGKELLCGPTSLHYPVRRAAINGRGIKDVVLNDGFPDVILYLAPHYWPVFRDAVSDALCRLYAADPKSRDVCNPAETPAQPVNQQLIFVTHSLGANVLLDTLCEQLDCVEQSHGNVAPVTKHRRLREAIQTSMGRATPFYMLANQYVLLELIKARPNDFGPGAREEPKGDVRRHPFFQSLKPQVQPDGSIRPGSFGDGISSVDIVAFSDPNDDLSFLLPKFPARGPASGNGISSFVTVQNVLVKNDWEVLWTLENPSTAHTGYLHSPATSGVFDVIFCGMTTAGLGKC